MKTEDELAMLIAICDKLCHDLSVMAANELKYSHELCEYCERMSWDAWKMSGDIKFIADRFGGQWVRE